MSTIKTNDCCSEQTTEGITNLLSDIQSSESSTEFILGVPSGKEIDRTREEDLYIQLDNKSYNVRLTASTAPRMTRMASKAS